MLIAETDQGLRERLHGRFLDVDVFSDCVGNGSDALRKLEESRYNLIVADVGLPDRGIQKIVGRVAAMRRAERPIVLVLAATPEAARSLDVEIVQIVLRRPVDINQLVDLVHNCIRSTSASKREGQANGNGDGNGDGEGDGDHVTS